MELNTERSTILCNEEMILFLLVTIFATCAFYFVYHFVWEDLFILYEIYQKNHSTVLINLITLLKEF